MPHKRPVLAKWMKKNNLTNNNLEEIKKGEVMKRTLMMRTTNRSNDYILLTIDEVDVKKI